MNINRQWLLAKRPHGMVGEENFEYVETPIPEPGDGEVLVRNLMRSQRNATPLWASISQIDMATMLVLSDLATNVFENVIDLFCLLVVVEMSCLPHCQTELYDFLFGV